MSSQGALVAEDGREVVTLTYSLRWHWRPKRTWNMDVTVCRKSFSQDLKFDDIGNFMDMLEPEYRC